MATLKPLRFLRPQPEKAAEVCCLPYDVMNTAEARDMAEGKPLSFLRVTRPEIEMDDSVDPYSHEVYEHGAANLQKMITEGVLFQDDEPVYMLYKLKMGAHEQIGIVAGASCSEYDNDIVKKHELTRPDKENDRTNHMLTLGAQTGAVFLTYKASQEIDSLITELSAPAPDFDFIAEDGIGHTVWVIKDAAANARIEEAFKKIPALYVADGHHRSAAASRAAKELATENPNHTGEEDYNFFLTVTFPHDQMQILGYYRVVKDLCGMTEDEFFDKLFKVAEISEPPADNLPKRKGEVTVYTKSGWKLVRWDKEIADHGNTVARLDVSVLQDHVLSPILKIGNPRTDKRISFVGGIRGTKELEKLVNSGEFEVAFALYPTSIEDLMRIADEGGLMPPKSTWFEPKLRDAVAVHKIK